MEDNISKIKDRLDVVDVIGSYIKLTKAGVNFRAKCPFHNEKTPSFFVSPEKQIWHCFSCGSGGDIFGFVKEIEGVEFVEAMRILAARAGVTLTYNQASRPEVGRTELYDVNELASRFFEKQLASSFMGEKVRKYLADRGVSEDSIKSFRLGYAPDSWQALGEFLGSKFSSPSIFNAGLSIKKDNGGYYDRFRGRIMFPIFNLHGQVVGFSGRIFEKKQEAPTAGGAEVPAKYVNSPQTPIYDKSRILYGLNAAKLDIRRDDRCVVVEGNMDVIMSHQAGLTNTVASSGTALTDGHLKIIKRYTDNLDICFDADDAGIAATERGVDLALASGFNVNIIAVREPGIKDPADFVVKHGSAWKDYAQKNSQPFLDFYFSDFKKRFDLTTAVGKKIMSRKFMPFVASLQNNIERQHWIQQMAFALHVGEDVVRAELQSLPLARPAAEAGKAQTVNSESETKTLSIYEENLLSMALRRPALLTVLQDNKTIFSDLMNELVESKMNADNKLAAGEPVHHVAESANRKFTLDLAQLKADEQWRDFSDQAIDIEFDKLLNQMKRRTIAKQLGHLEFSIKDAEQNGDKQQVAALLAQFSKLSEDLIAR